MSRRGLKRRYRTASSVETRLTATVPTNLDKVQRTHEAVFIAQKMAGHADHSGYHKAAHVLPSKATIFPPDRKLRGWGYFAKKSGLSWYSRKQLRAEVSAACHWLTSSQTKLFHYLYGENGYRYLGNLRARSSKHRIVASYHLPYDKFCEKVRYIKHLQYLDAAIVVARSQLDWMTKMVGGIVRYIPHGIDTDFFHPLEKSSSKFKILTVGNHLRDYEVVNQVISQLAKSKLDLEFHIVANQQNLSRLPRHPRVIAHQGVSDEKLLELYQSSSVLLLPLLQATANNTLLEALACGLPIISSDLDGVRDYVCKDGAILESNQVPSHFIGAIEGLYSNRSLLEPMGNANRQRALELSWPQIGKQFHALYRDIS